MTVAEPSGASAFLAASAGLPHPLDVEMPRPGLIRRLEQRWDAHEDSVRLAHTLLDAVSAGHGRGGRAAPGARDVIDAVIRKAPLEVCLLLDDVHEIPTGSPGAMLLREVAMTLPATAHLVLSGREAPELPLARREAAGELIRLGSADLAFTDVEVSALARRLGRDSSVAAAVQGWPALVRLAFAAGSGAPWQYAREEILNRLPDRSAGPWPRWPHSAPPPPARSWRSPAGRSPLMTWSGGPRWSANWAAAGIAHTTCGPTRCRTQ